MKNILALQPLAVLLVLTPCTVAGEFKFADGDRIVLVGNTLIEREQRYGYWEAALTARYPDRNLMFRNLGWSGDTVFGEARASFDPPEVGFRRLKDHVLALKPTVIILGYGLNESFGGASGLPRFQKGLDTLIEALAPAKARLVLLAPLRQEDLGRPLPDPSENNRHLRLYRDALRQTAEKRGFTFVDLYDLLPEGARAKPAEPLTDNGIHLTGHGYWRAARAVEHGLGLTAPRWRVEIDKEGKPTTSTGVQLDRVQAAPLRFQAADAVLPEPLDPDAAPLKSRKADAERILRVQGLAEGKYSLKVDGQPVALATAREWAEGVKLSRGPEFEQVEKLRKTIIDKNRLYFHRWRPQNETYLFGFRKHEQGQNAREIPQFDPLVAKLEEDIAKLRVPVAHQYELIAEQK